MRVNSLARYLPKQLPGQPVVVVTTPAGGGGASFTGTDGARQLKLTESQATGQPVSVSLGPDAQLVQR